MGGLLMGNFEVEIYIFLGLWFLIYLLFLISGYES